MFKKQSQALILHTTSQIYLLSHPIVPYPFTLSFFLLFHFFYLTYLCLKFYYFHIFLFITYLYINSSCPLPLLRGEWSV